MRAVLILIGLTFALATAGPFMARSMAALHTVSDTLEGGR